MSKFTKQIKKTYEFEGDTIQVSMKRLKRKDAIKLAPFISSGDEDGKVSMSFEDSLVFADKSSSILNKYVTDFTGLKEEDGTPLEVSDIFGDDGEVYFIGLISEMMADLMEASFVGDSEKEKKLDVPQADTLKGLDMNVQVSEESP